MAVPSLLPSPISLGARQGKTASGQQQYTGYLGNAAYSVPASGYWLLRQFGVFTRGNVWFNVLAFKD
jgi:hypothetical protein